MSRNYLCVSDILEIHTALLRRYGGATGIREIGLIESAVARPQCGYYVSIVEEACALFESLLINHPFVDGNKRTAFAAFDVFLEINNCTLNISDTVCYDLMIRWLSVSSEKRFKTMCVDIKDFISME